MKYTKCLLAALLAALALASCERELTAEEKAAKFTYPDKNGEATVIYKEGDSFELDSFTFTVKEEGTAHVTKYTGKANAVIIPEKAKGLKITGVADGVFAENPVITTVEFSKYVTEVGDKAFYNCVNLFRIIGTDNLQHVGADAFTGTAAASYSDKEFVTIGKDILVEYNGEGGVVTVPDGIRVIASAFSNKDGIVEIKLPRSLKSIGSSAFEGCKDLVSIDIPGGTHSIGNRAFANCSSLTDIYIPFDVSELGESIFDGCTDALSVLCTSGSPAESYCREYGINIKN